MKILNIDQECHLRIYIIREYDMISISERMSSSRNMNVNNILEITSSDDRTYLQLHTGSTILRYIVVCLRPLPQ